MPFNSHNFIQTKLHFFLSQLLHDQPFEQKDTSSSESKTCQYPLHVFRKSSSKSDSDQSSEQSSENSIPKVELSPLEEEKDGITFSMDSPSCKISENSNDPQSFCGSKELHEILQCINLANQSSLWHVFDLNGSGLDCAAVKRILTTYSPILESVFSRVDQLISALGPTRETEEKREKVLKRRLASPFSLYLFCFLN